MAQEPVNIEAVRNRKTQKLFVLVDDTLDKRYKVINPGGEVLILPDLLFDEDPLTIAASEFAVEFTPEQLDAFAKFQDHAAAQAAQLKAASQRPSAVQRMPEPPPKKRSPARRETTTGQTRRGLGAAWNAPRLTFYKHKIEPLHLKQSFKITVEGTGEFEITKEEFLAQFNDVVMSPSYRSDGLFTYPKVPDKARRYLKG